MDRWRPGTRGEVSDVVQQVAAATDDELFTALEEATAAALIEERVAGSVLSYRFTHALFRQSLYEAMIAPRRDRLHQAIGRALEAAYAPAPAVCDGSVIFAMHHLHTTHRRSRYPAARHEKGERP